jgi:hypothetical protein
MQKCLIKMHLLYGGMEIIIVLKFNNKSYPSDFVLNLTVKISGCRTFQKKTFFFIYSENLYLDIFKKNLEYQRN